MRDNTHWIQSAFRRQFALAAVVLLLAFVANAANAQEGRTVTKETIPTLTVRGMAELEKPADQLMITIGVITEHQNATSALEENSTRMQAVVDALKDVGLGEKEYETGRFQIRPVYQPRPPQQRHDPEWRPRIVAYSVTNTVQVKTQQLDLAGKLIQKANEAGANTIDNISFGLASPRVHRAEAISAATSNAIADAHVLARSAKLRLVRIVRIELDPEDGMPRPIPMYARMEMAAAAAPDAPPIQPGDVTVRAAVNVVYEIAPAE
jgi:uncharacterized protein